MKLMKRLKKKGTLTDSCGRKRNLSNKSFGYIN